MIQSPCRHCPKRHMDKNLCARSCNLLDKIQRFEASRGMQQAWVAIDLEDTDRYQLTVSFDYHRPKLSNMPI